MKNVLGNFTCDCGRPAKMEISSVTNMYPIYYDDPKGTTYDEPFESFENDDYRYYCISCASKAGYYDEDSIPILLRILELGHPDNRPQGSWDDRDDPTIDDKIDRQKEKEGGDE